MGKFGKGDTSWFVKDRFGMFIHWGLYSMPARGDAEWIRNGEQITDEDYQKYFDHFNPDLFDPRAWAKAAREAGMKYFVITTKHHEGFCMWDTKYTEYKVTNTPAKRDLIREVVEAFRAEGLRVGFYYSTLDWNHPDYIIDTFYGPYRKLSEEDRKKKNQGRDMKRYTEFMRNQVRELLTNYGKIDIFWSDFSYPVDGNPEHGKDHNDWESEELVKLIRSLQPDIVLDDRLDLPNEGDIITPEQYTPDEPVVDKDGNPVVWEGCQTFSGSWGYNRDQQSWKSPKQCIDMLINHVSRNGNLLMNVGPTSRGYLDYRAMNCLKAYADWMHLHNRSIYNCGAAPEGIKAPLDCRYTYNKETNRLYLHLMNWPFKHLHLHGLAGKVAYAQLLNDCSEIQFHDKLGDLHPTMNSKTPEGAITLDLPVVKPNVEVPVIEIFLK